MTGYEVPVPLNSQPKPLKELTEVHLVSFAFQVARGVEYLSDKHVSWRQMLSPVTAASELETN